METSDAISSLEQRISKLERETYGSVMPDKDVKCLDSLLGIQNRLQSAVTGRNKITSLFSKLDDLKKYISPEFKENVSLSESCKLSLVLLEEDRIRNVVDALQTVKDLQQYLDSETIRAVPSLLPKFCSLSQVHVELEEQVSSLSAETRNLIAAYDSIIMTISKEFILWDLILTKLEEDKSVQPKKR